MRFRDYTPDYSGQPEPGYEQEPTIERGKDRLRFWSRVLIAVVIAGIIIGYAASVSYVFYPYTVNVHGSFTSPEGGKIQILGLVACDEWLYANESCPSPGEPQAWDCLAPDDMNLGHFCALYYFESDPGQYNIALKNGRDYAVTAYLQYSNGLFDKVCNATIILSPSLSGRNSTQNFSC